jgi:hypothetical protein
MLPVASITSDLATAVGLLAGVIGIGGFLSHARPGLTGASERQVRRATVRGGLVGFGFGAFVVVLSAFFGSVTG